MKMLMSSRVICVTLLAFSQASIAHDIAGSLKQSPDTTFFSLNARVDDVALSRTRGGASPFSGRLTAGTVFRLADDNSRADLRLMGGIGGIAMDVWWGTIGSELIGESVRAADRPMP